MKKSYFLLCSMLVVLVPTVAQAIVITNVTQGNQILFYDDYESAPAASSAAAPDVSGDYDPVPNVGSYLYFEAPEDLVQVTNFASPGAFAGTNYLRLTTGPQEHQAQLSATPNSGDHINISFRAYFPTFPTTGNLAVFKVRADGLGTDHQVAGARATPGGVVADLDGTATSLTYLAGVWQEWEFDYVIDAPTYTMSVGGVSSGPISNAPRGGPGNIQGMGFWQGSTDNIAYFLDSPTLAPVPEPSSIALLSCGLMGLAAVARKARRKHASR